MDIEYSNPQLFDFTTLDNYVAPENTLEAFNPTWIDAKSHFYSLGEYHIFTESCERRKPEEVEFTPAKTVLSDEQHDALLSLKIADLIPLDKEDKAILKNMNIAAFFRYKSIIHARGIHGIAAVINNELVFVS